MPGLSFLLDMQFFEIISVKFNTVSLFLNIAAVLGWLIGLKYGWSIGLKYG